MFRGTHFLQIILPFYRWTGHSNWISCSLYTDIVYDWRIINHTLRQARPGEQAHVIGNKPSCINNIPSIKTTSLNWISGRKRITCRLFGTSLPSYIKQIIVLCSHWPDSNFSLSIVGIWFAKINLRPLILFPQLLTRPFQSTHETGIHVCLLCTSEWRVGEFVCIQWQNFVLKSNVFCQRRIVNKTAVDVWNMDKTMTVITFTVCNITLLKPPG